MRELFIYYRVAAADAAAVRRCVEALQAELRTATPGLVGRLLRRPGDDAGMQTWMETYAFDGERASGIGIELQAEIEAAASRHLGALAGARHVEVFIGLDD